MILDAQLAMSNAQAITTTASSTNVIDLGQGGDPLCVDMYYHLMVDVTCTAGGAATVKFDLETSDDESFSTGTKILYSVPATAVASLTAGKHLADIKLPFGLKRFVRTNYIVATGPLTAGKFSAYINADYVQR